MPLIISNDNEQREIGDENLHSNVSIQSKNSSISSNEQTTDQTLLSLITNTNTPITVTQYQCQTSSIITNPNQQKRHIMISYNHSSIEICQQIYQRLMERNYKVWMNFEHMYDDALTRMKQAIDNSYIILLCINQQYYESDYCRLEVEYAFKKRIKFIPCLMEEAFRPQSWLGIIKGSNMHIDFSSLNDFNQSFEQLIRQINFIEKNYLSFQFQHNPSIHRSLLNEEEFFLKQLIHRTLEQNEFLLKLIDQLIKQRRRRQHFNINNIIKSLLTIAFLCLLITYYQKL